MTDFVGTTGNDVLKGTSKDDTFDLSQGGNDKVNGGGGDDVFSFGDKFTAADRVTGGGGSDTVVLDGDYSSGLVFGAHSLKAVEEIDLTHGSDYVLTTNDANLAAGQTMAIGATDLGAGDSVTFNGSRETDGAFAFSVRFAHAVLTGGAGDDSFRIGDSLASTGQGPGGSGGDVLTSGGGADHFDFLSLGKAAGRPHEITDLTNTDLIDIHALDANKGAAGDQAFTLVGQFTHHAGEALLSFDAETQKTSLMLDTNGDAKADHIVLLDGDHTDFTSFVL